MAEDKQTKSATAWKAPITRQDVWKMYSARQGDSADTRAIHRKWNRVAHEAGLTQRY